MFAIVQEKRGKCEILQDKTLQKKIILRFISGGPAAGKFQFFNRFFCGDETYTE